MSGTTKKKVKKRKAASGRRTSKKVVRKKVDADVLADRAAAAKWCGRSPRTLMRWETAGLVRLDGGRYSKKLIKAFRKKMEKDAIDRKLKRVAVSAPVTLTEGYEDLDEREKDRLRKEKKRKAARDVKIGKVQNPKRRRRCEPQPELFLSEYFPDIFYNPFTPDQKEIIAEVKARIENGGWKAIAAERGGGKSSIVRCVAIWAIVYGKVKYLVILAATGPFSDDILDEIKDAFEYNELLAADFPEVCDPVWALEGAPQRASSQTVGGQRTRLEWSGHRVVFPYVKVGREYSPASGVIVTARGLDAAIRGLVKGANRPDFVLTDDVETRASAESEVETARRLRTLNNDVLGLVGPGEIMPVVLLGTIIKRDCMIDQITDRTKNPAWHGVRHKRLKKEPDRVDLWEKYIARRRRDQLDDDETARKAHAYYLKLRKKMDAGAVVSNENRYKAMELADGTQLEVSALQSCYNDISDMGREAFNSEYQGEPPSDTAEGSGIQLVSVQKKLNGIGRAIAPQRIDKLVAAIDVRRREIHFTVTGFGVGAIGSVIDYGAEDVHSPAGNIYDSEISKAVDDAIYSALWRFHERVKATGFASEGSDKRLGLDLCLIDAGWHPDAIYQFCLDAGAIYKPSLGFGKNSRAGKFRHAGQKQKGDQHWRADIVPGKRLWRFGLDVDYYKQRVHDGFMIDAKSRGSLSVFGDDPVVHRLYAEQILAEQWVRDFKPGKGWVEGFVVKSRRNHWLDTTAQTVAGAELLGINLVAAAPQAAGTRETTTISATRSSGNIRTKY